VLARVSAFNIHAKFERLMLQNDREIKVRVYVYRNVIVRNEKVGAVKKIFFRLKHSLCVFYPFAKARG
jgi:hypothetical protein